MLPVSGVRRDCFLEKTIASQDNKDHESLYADNAQIYGHKAAQLMRLEEMTEQWQDLLVPVRIPHFSAISTQEIQRHIGTWLDERWADFCKAQGDSRELTEEAKFILSDIRKKICTRFEEDIFSPAKKPAGALMVRSSGAEDRKDLDNAGGNTTESNVVGDADTLSKAIGSVIASYFGENSLIQRLLAGDDIRRPPTMGVILQTMVGGSPDDPLHIVSGVGYREEPLAKTPHTSAIHAAPGHGEFVVTGEGVIDDYYVTRQEGIEPIVRRKPFCMVPSEDGGLLTGCNRPDIAAGSSMPTECLITLHRIMGHLQDVYAGSGVDIEFVLDKGNSENPPCLYLVQARPRVLETKALHPQYVVAGSEVKKLSGTCTIGGTLEVLKDVQEEEIIRSLTLSDAFERYKHMSSEEQARIRCVLTYYPGRRMSHEGCHFHRLRIPVVCAGNSYQNAPTPFHLETVSGTLYSGSDIEIKEGLKESPIPRERSLCSSITHLPSQHTNDVRTIASIKELLEMAKIATDPNCIDILENTLMRFFALSLKDSLNHTVLAHNVFREIARVRHAIQHYPPESPERLLPIKFLEALVFQDKGISIKQLLAEKKHRKTICAQYGASPDNKEEYFLYMHMANLCISKDNRLKWHDFVTAILEDPIRSKQLEEMLVRLTKLNMCTEWMNFCFNSENRSSIEDPIAYFDTLWERYQDITETISGIEWTASFMEIYSMQMQKFSNPEFFPTKTCQLFLQQLTSTIKGTAEALSDIGTKYPISAEEQCVGCVLFRQLLDLIELYDQSIKTMTSAPDASYPTHIKLYNFSYMLDTMISALAEIASRVPLQVVANIQGQKTQYARPDFLMEHVKWFYQQYLRVAESEMGIEQLTTRPEFNVQEGRLPSMDFFTNKPRPDLKSQSVATLEEVFTTTHGYMKDLVSAWQQASTCSKHLSINSLEEYFPLAAPLLPQSILYPKARRSGDGVTTPSSYYRQTLRGQHIEERISLPGQAHEGEIRSSIDISTQKVTYALKMVGDSGYSRGGNDRWKNVFLYAKLGARLLGLEEINPTFVRRLGYGFSEFLATWSCDPKAIGQDPAIFRTQLEALLSLMTTATMPDAIVPKSQLHRFKWSNNNSVGQVLHNLSVVFGHEAVQTLVENLDPAFYHVDCGVHLSQSELVGALREINTKSEK